MNDKIDEMLFEYFDKQETPSYVDKAINTALNNRRGKSMIKWKSKVASILAVIVLFTGVVFAKDIEQTINKVFNNSSKGIETAVDNGYVQNINMDYVTNNNFSVKADYVLVDNKNLDIAFNYKYDDATVEVMGIGFAQIIIKDENNNIWYYSDINNMNMEYLEKQLSNSMRRDKEPSRISNNNLVDSIHIGAEAFPKSKILYIESNKVFLETKEENKVINGDWKFTINLDDKFSNRSEIRYIAEPNKYLSNLEANLSDTQLSLDITLNRTADTALLMNSNNIGLTDANGKEFSYINQISVGNKENSCVIKTGFNITKYDATDNLILRLKIDKDTELNIKLNREDI